MTASLYVDASYSLLNEVVDDQQNLLAVIRELTGERLRRVDRFTLLALVSALQCGDTGALSPHSGMVLATSTGALTTTVDMMNKIRLEKLPPKPFQFVNSLGNSACYSLSRMLGISGPSLAVSQEHLSFESGLEHAQLMLSSGSAPQVLVGGVDEAPLPISFHFRRHGVSDADFDACYEGGHWLRVSAEKRGPSFAKIQAVGSVATVSGIRGLLAEAAKVDGSLLPINTDTCKVFLSSAGEPVVTDEGTRVMKHGTYSGHQFVQACNYVRNNPSVWAVVATQIERGGKYNVSAVMQA